MHFSDYFFLTSRQLKMRKLRTLLTMLAISVGIGTIFLLVSFVYGVQNLITKRIAPAETLLTIDILPGKLMKLNDEALVKLKKVSDIESLSPLLSLSGQATTKDSTLYADLVMNGIEPRFIIYDGLKIIKGRNIKEGASESLLTEAASKLFSAQGEVIGKKVKAIALVPRGENSQEFDRKELAKELEIVGIVENAESAVLFLSLNDLETVITQPSYSLIKAKINRAENISKTKSEILALGLEASAIFETIEETGRLFGYAKWVFTLLGLIALFVASIGMFNTLTISLLERIRDIGFMKAFGGANQDVRNLFLVEATIMGFGGGLLGIILGGVIARLINFLVNLVVSSVGAPKLTIFLSPYWFVIFILIFSAVLGFITGIYPARRASKISPLEAIRYE